MTAPVCRDVDGAEIAVGDTVECVRADDDCCGRYAEPGAIFGPVTATRYVTFSTDPDGEGQWLASDFRRRLPPAEPPATEGVGEVETLRASVRVLERGLLGLLENIGSAAPTDTVFIAPTDDAVAKAWFALRTLARSKADGGGT